MFEVYDSCSDVSVSPEKSRRAHFSSSSSKKETSLEYSDDSEEVFEKEECKDYDKAVTDYLDELQSQSPIQKSLPMETWITSEPMKTSSLMDIEEYR